MTKWPKWLTYSLVILGFLLVCFVVVAIVIEVLRFPASSSSLLSLLGAVMGAVFTVGGLVIALMSALMYFTLNERAGVAVETKINELFPEFDRRMDGRIYLKTAEQLAEQSGGQDWRGIKGNIDRALNSDPRLYTAGYGLLGEIAAEHMLSVYLELWQIVKNPYDLQPDLPATNIETALWLERASSEKDTGKGKGRALMFHALISALDGRYDDMIKKVEGLKNFPDRLSELRKPRYLCVLVRACIDDWANPGRCRVSEEKLNKLGEALSVPDNPSSLPATKEKLTKDLNNEPEKYRPGRGGELPGWCVMPRPTAEPEKLRVYVLPNRLSIMPCDKEGHYAVMKVHYQSSQPGEFTEVDLDLGDHEQQCGYPLGELVDELLKKFYFICYLPDKGNIDLMWGRYRPWSSWLRSRSGRLTQ